MDYKTIIVKGTVLIEKWLDKQDKSVKDSDEIKELMKTAKKSS